MPLKLNIIAGYVQYALIGWGTFIWGGYDLYVSDESNTITAMLLVFVSIYRVNSNVNWIKIIIPKHLKIKKLYRSYTTKLLHAQKMYLLIKINENQLIN